MSELTALNKEVRALIEKLDPPCQQKLARPDEYILQLFLTAEDAVRLRDAIKTKSSPELYV